MSTSLRDKVKSFFIKFLAGIIVASIIFGIFALWVLAFWLERVRFVF